MCCDPVEPLTNKLCDATERTDKRSYIIQKIVQYEDIYVYIIGLHVMDNLARYAYTYDNFN